MHIQAIKGIHKFRSNADTSCCRKTAEEKKHFFHENKQASLEKNALFGEFSNDSIPVF